MREAAQSSPKALKYPIVVDWDAGKIAVGDMGAVQSILEGRLKIRDGEEGSTPGESGAKPGSSKGLLRSLFGKQ